MDKYKDKEPDYKRRNEKDKPHYSSSEKRAMSLRPGEENDPKYSSPKRGSSQGGGSAQDIKANQMRH